MKISELIGSLQRCDPNLDVEAVIKYARVLGTSELGALSVKERKRVPLRQGKPVAFEPLVLPPPGPAVAVRPSEPSLNERLARAFVSAA